jgi:hypothetical protein
MPFYVRIEAFTELNNYKTALIFEPIWWSYFRLQQKYNFIAVTADSGYLDYYLDLNKELFEQIIIEQTEPPDSRIYQNEAWTPVRKAAKANFEIIRNNFDSYKLVRINIAEYDSDSMD